MQSKLRLIAIILSILVIKLSVLPCCLESSNSESAHVKEACCQQGAASSSEEDSNEERNACSPFFSCCAGAGFVFMKPMLKLDKLKLMEVSSSFTYLNHYSFMWNGSVFQPPQTRA